MSNLKKKEYEYSAHGISEKEYICLPNIPCWIKVLHYVMHWYLKPQHKNQVFFMSYKGIVNAFKKMGFKDCNERLIEEAFRI